MNPDLPLPRDHGLQPRKRHDEIEADLQRKVGELTQDINRYRAIIWKLAGLVATEFETGSDDQITVDLNEVPECWDLEEFWPTTMPNVVHLRATVNDGEIKRLDG